MSRCIYHVVTKSKTNNLNLYFDNYKSAKYIYDEAVSDDCDRAFINSCEFVDGLLSETGNIETYTRKNK